MTGCGVFDKKDLNDEHLLGTDEYVDYNGTGEYDLSDYLFPSENKTLNYRVTSFRAINNEDYDLKNPQSINNNKLNEYVHNGNKVSLNQNIEYSIETKIIEKKELIENFYDTRKFRRYLNVGEVYYSYENVDLKGKYHRLGKLVCKIEEHNTTKKILGKNYNDVLQLGCEGDFIERVRDNSFSIKKSFKTTDFYAKKSGFIGGISQRCETTTTGDESYKECTRIETLLSNE